MGWLCCIFGFSSIITFLFYTSATHIISTPSVWKSTVHLEIGVLGSLGTAKCHLNVYQPALPCSWCPSSGLTQSATLQGCCATCWSRLTSSWSIPKHMGPFVGKVTARTDPLRLQILLKNEPLLSSKKAFWPPEVSLKVTGSVGLNWELVLLPQPKRWLCSFRSVVLLAPQISDLSTLQKWKFSFLIRTVTSFSHSMNQFSLSASIHPHVKDFSCPWLFPTLFQPAPSVPQYPKTGTSKRNFECVPFFPFF